MPRDRARSIDAAAGRPYAFGGCRRGGWAALAV